MSYLKRCVVFQQLDFQQLAGLDCHSRLRTFPARSLVYLKGVPAQDVYLVVSGQIKTYHLTPEGKESILMFVEPGELFGEMAVLGDHEREEYVQAIQAATVLVIPAEKLRCLMLERPDTAVALTRLIGLRRQRIERRLKHVLFRNNHDRLVHLLLELAQQHGEESGTAIRLRVRLSHQDLANFIGSTRETVTIILGQMKAAGLIGGGRREIVLLRPDRLAQRVETSQVGNSQGSELHLAVAPL